MANSETQRPHDCRQPRYTDMGPGIVMHDDEGGSMPLPRYGVWQWDAARGRHQVVDVGDDLAALRTKYGDGPLVDLPRPSGPD